jgi:hypothetical protein
MRLFNKKHLIPETKKFTRGSKIFQEIMTAIMCTILKSMMDLWESLSTTEQDI